MALKSKISKVLFNQNVAGMAACLSMLASGSCYGWITPILNHLLSPASEIPVTPAQIAMVASFIEFGNLLSPLPVAMLVNYFGRKRVLLSTLPVYLVGWVMILYYRTASMLIAARAVHGFAMGAVYTVVPVYLGEIASDSSRGAIISMSSYAWWIGYLIELVVGPLLDFYNFTYLTIAFHLLFLLIFMWQPESPHYYVMVGEDNKAYQALKRLRNQQPLLLTQELERIKESIKTRKCTAGVTDIIATAEDRKALLLINILTSVRVLSGCGALLIFATKTFDATPNLFVSPDLVTVAFGILMFSGGFVSSFILDIFGRRPLLLVCCIGSSLCHCIIGSFYLLHYHTCLNVSKYSCIPLIFIFVYSGFRSLGLYPVNAIYISELFTPMTRGTASSIVEFNVTILTFLMLMWFEPVTNNFGLFINFYIYALSCFIGSFYFYFNAPETKGKSFIQIRKDLL